MLKTSISKLYAHISKRRRSQFKSVLLLTVFSAFAEIISLGAVVPFIAVITSPKNILEYPLIVNINQLLNFEANQNLTAIISVFFIIAAVLSGTLRILLLKASISLGNATGADLSFKMFSITLNQSYISHIRSSSNDFISGITQKVTVATSVLASLITIITNLILFVAIFVILLLIDPLIAGAAFTAFGSVYLAISLISKKVLAQNGETIAAHQTKIVKISQEGISSMRDVIIHKRQHFYGDLYHKSLKKLRYSIGLNQFITLSPRFAMETVALVLIGIFTLYISDRSDLIVSSMPTLGALALGAQRLLPILQQIYGSYGNIVGNHQSLVDVLTVLERKPNNLLNSSVSEKITFKRKINLSHVTFSFSPNTSLILKDINIEVLKGQIIGFVGPTGSGKSTAMDIILGLLNPSDGNLLVDGSKIGQLNIDSWQNKLAHVPQNIYLADTSIAENIAFGISVEHIDLDRVKSVGDKAQITDFVSKTPEGYNTVVGERGIKLSGGQRQRIGIARALYNRSEVLVLDEATSALDTKTEELVMSAIGSLDSDLTIIVIAHRINTLKICDKIFEFNQNGNCSQTTYGSLLKKERR